MTPTVDLSQLIQLRDHHLAEARRIDAAIEVVKDAAKHARTAARTMAGVRAQVGDEAPPKAKAKRATKAARVSAVQRARKKDRSTPTDQVRRVFIQAGERMLTRAELLNAIGDVGGESARGGRVGQSARVLGVVLSGLRRRKEIKPSGDGFVARHVVDPDATPNTNGAHP